MKNFIFIFSFVVFFLPTVSHGSVATPAELQHKYNATKVGDEKIKILIVPGHDNQVWGTEFNDIKEVELNRIVADKLYTIFAKDSAFEVFTTQQNGNYTESFSIYLERNWNAIRKFKDEHIAAMKKSYASGSIEKVESVEHNTAQEDVAITLYGANKWANENDIDLVIHIHFNDHGGRVWNQEGDYTGFTVYVPESQLKNAEASNAIAQKVFAQLAQFSPISNLPGEEKGVTPDQDLIAIGSHNSLESASLLIEYGYIYEPQVVSSVLRDAALHDYAYRTYLGVKDFFNASIPQTVDSLLFPRVFAKDLKKGIKENVEVFALQKVLTQEGVYPGVGKTLNECPISGNFGPCTENAVKAFQKKHNLPTTGLVGPMTRKVINTTYSLF